MVREPEVASARSESKRRSRISRQEFAITRETKKARGKRTNETKGKSRPIEKGDRGRQISGTIGTPRSRSGDHSGQNFLFIVVRGWRTLTRNRTLAGPYLGIVDAPVSYPPEHSASCKEPWPRSSRAPSWSSAREPAPSDSSQLVDRWSRAC